MAMPTYEELLAIVKMQQATIEELTEKLAKAEARIAELEEQLESRNWKNNCIRIAITAVSHRHQMATKNLRQRVCARKAVKKQADKRGIRDIIWHLIIRIESKKYTRSIARTVPTGRTAPI